MSYIKKPTTGRAYRSGKNYDHSVGLSCCFRQWRAESSHCRYLHGYALRVELGFRTNELDGRNWCVNFGELKPIKVWLEEQFDHKTLVARDDPMLPLFKMLDEIGLIQINVVEATGCEAMARIIYDHVQQWLVDVGLTSTSSPARTRSVILEKVRVCEHDGNWGEYGLD
jgi:6-pyruvoyltetrahydropterin/6-carboxytetrahydropterin synthase